MLNDTYKEIKTSSTGSYKEKGSKFISYCFPVHSKKEIKEKIESVKKIEQSARHHCYAYILSTNESEQRVNDDGEPSSTAGKPILGQILSNNLTNILIVVVRYFGGVKLGVPGLIRSYKSAAADAISNSIIIIKTIKEQYELSFEYPQMNDVMRLVKEFNLEIINTDFQIECKLKFAINKSLSQNHINSIKENYKIKIKYIKTV